MFTGLFGWLASEHMTTSDAYSGFWKWMINDLFNGFWAQAAATLLIALGLWFGVRWQRLQLCLICFFAAGVIMYGSGLLHFITGG